MNHSSLANKRGALRFLAALCLCFGATSTSAWEVRCTTGQGGPECRDPFERVRTPWRNDPLAEHGALLHQSIAYSGLPPAFLEPFELTIYAGSQMFSGPDSTQYASVNPLLSGVERTDTRTVYVQGMANLPDFAYTLADWSSGAETCPPDPNNPDPFDCHNYETHIGWLNSNHMLPQSRKWYEHLHAIALNRAAACNAAYLVTPLDHRDRYKPYQLACEKLALAVEGVAQHYLQDSWALGHMWERWGGTEIADFGGNRALGFAIGAFSGIIHGAKAMLDANSLTSGLAPWDDPLNAPHPDGTYRDGGVLGPGVGDLFLFELLGSPGDAFGPQRRALFGCEVNGLRAVYDATAKVHGPLESADIANVDISRSVSNGSCWNQRATNRAMATGMGIYLGEAPNAVPVHENQYIPLIMAQSFVAPPLAGASELSMDPVTLVRFNVDAAMVTAYALMEGRLSPDDTTVASGLLGPIVSVGTNSRYERGHAATGVLPATYADPMPPWRVKETDPAVARRSVPLNLTFADANATDRCNELTTPDLEVLRDAVSEARAQGLPAAQIAARCGRCAQIVAPHLRFGTSEIFDERRKAYCELVAPGSTAFMYTQEPGPFTGQEPTDFASLQEAALSVCGCGPRSPRLRALFPGLIFAPANLIVTVEMPVDETAFQPAPNVVVQLSPICATAIPAGGLTDARGKFVSVVTAIAGCSSLSIAVTANTAPVLQTSVNASVSTSPIPVLGGYDGTATLEVLGCLDCGPTSLPERWSLEGQTATTFILNRLVPPQGTCLAFGTETCTPAFSITAGSFQMTGPSGNTISGTVENGTLQFVYDRACFFNQPDTCRTTFEGVRPIQVTPTSLDFGTVAVGATRIQFVTIRNAGPLPVRFGLENGPGGSAFTVPANNCLVPNAGLPLPSLESGSECGFPVKFTPLGGGGIFTGNVVIVTEVNASNDGSGDRDKDKVLLIGVGN